MLDKIHKEMIDEMESEGCELVENVRGKRSKINGIYDDAMTNQEKLEFKDRYLNFVNYLKHNPIAFAEEFNPGIKLSHWQKLFLKAICLKDKTISYIDPYKSQKRFIAQQKLELMKAMNMDFQVWKPDCIEVYEKGVLVRTIKS